MWFNSWSCPESLTSGNWFDLGQRHLPGQCSPKKHPKKVHFKVNQLTSQQSQGSEWTHFHQTASPACRVLTPGSPHVLPTGAQHHQRRSQGKGKKKEKRDKNKTTPRKTFQKCCTKSGHSAERGFLCSESWPGTEQEITASCLQRKRLSRARDQKQTALQLNKQRAENFNSSSLGRLQRAETPPKIRGL